MELPKGKEPHFSRYLAFIKSRPIREYKKRMGLVHHHILPKSMGANPDFLSEPENIIILTNREHYIAHLILWKCYDKDGRMAYAFHMLSCIQNQHRRLTSRQFENLRQEAFSEDIRQRKSVSMKTARIRKGMNWSSKKPQKFPPEYYEQLREQRAKTPEELAEKKRIAWTRKLGDEKYKQELSHKRSKAAKNTIRGTGSKVKCRQTGEVFPSLYAAAKYYELTTAAFRGIVKYSLGQVITQGNLKGLSFEIFE